MKKKVLVQTCSSAVDVWWIITGGCEAVHNEIVICQAVQVILETAVLRG